MANKNNWAKSRDKSNPYATFESAGWTWRVLKAYQSAEKETGNPHARVFCFVTSPYCPEGEYGDTYTRDIPGYQRPVSVT